MSVNIAALRRAVDVAISEEIPHLRERLDWADRDPTIAEAMCLTDREVAYILNVSTRTGSRFVEPGDLRAIYLTHPRRTRRFTLPDVKTFHPQAHLRELMSDYASPCSVATRSHAADYVGLAGSRPTMSDMAGVITDAEYGEAPGDHRQLVTLKRLVTRGQGDNRRSVRHPARSIKQGSQWDHGWPGPEDRPGAA